MEPHRGVGLMVAVLSLAALSLTKTVSSLTDRRHGVYGKVTLSCLTLCDPIDYTVHGILQVRILERVSLLQIFPTQGSNLGLLHCRRILYQLGYQGSLILT